MSLRRLNYSHEDCMNSIKELKDICLSSGFNKKVTLTMIQKVSAWTERFEPANHKNRQKRIRFHGQQAFHNFFSSRIIELKKLTAHKANVINKRTACLANTLTKYKTLAHKQQKTFRIDSSSPCGKCTICGKFGKYECMVRSTNHTKCKK